MEREMWPQRRSFRNWLSRRNPFVIGMVYGFMLPAYVIEGMAKGWWRAIQDMRRDRDFMVRWSQAPRTDRRRTHGE